MQNWCTARCGYGISFLNSPMLLKARKDAAVVPTVLFAALQIKDVRQCKAVEKNKSRKRGKKIREKKEPEVRRRIKDRQWGWESQERWGGEIWSTHTYSLINILWECGPMVNPSPGNNQEESLCCFFNMLPEFQWTNSNMQCEEERKKKEDEVRCTWVCWVCVYWGSIDVWAWTVR